MFHAVASTTNCKITKPAKNMYSLCISRAPKKTAAPAKTAMSTKTMERKAYLPNNPAGLNASVSNSNPNATAGAQDGP